MGLTFVIRSGNNGDWVLTTVTSSEKFGQNVYCPGRLRLCFDKCNRLTCSCDKILLIRYWLVTFKYSKYYFLELVKNSWIYNLICKNTYFVSDPVGWGSESTGIEHVLDCSNETNEGSNPFVVTTKSERSAVPAASRWR